MGDKSPWVTFNGNILKSDTRSNLACEKGKLKQGRDWLISENVLHHPSHRQWWPCPWWCRELHQGCWGDAEGHPKHGHNKQDIWFSAWLGNISIRRRSHLLDKITRSVGFTIWGGGGVSASKDSNGSCHGGRGDRASPLVLPRTGRTQDSSNVV